MNFGRLITAMATPFNDDSTSIDYKQTEVLIDHLIATGTETIIVAGTTGESPTLSWDEKKSLFEHVVNYVNGRVKVMAGTGGNNTATTIHHSNEAERIGVDGLLLVSPYYNRPSQQGLIAHFTAVANETTLPIMLYNVPARTGSNMSVDTIVSLSKIKNIFSVKEASGNIGQMSEIISATSDDFLLYSGDDGITLPVLSIGGYGIVSVCSHIIGKEMTQMIQSFLEGNVQEAATLHQRLYPIFTGMFITSNPVPLKAALKEMGIPIGDVRLPLVPATNDEIVHIKNLIHSLK